MNLAKHLQTEIEWVSDLEGYWYCEERFRAIQSRIKQADRDKLVIALESLSVRMDVAEYLEREEALQWLVAGMLLGNAEMRDKVSANDFCSYIAIIVRGIQTNTWEAENDHNLQVLLGVIRKPKQKLIDAILQAFAEDAAARSANGSRTGFGGKRWERLHRLRAEREKLGKVPLHDKERT